jgi:hypothetical protein
MSTGSGRFSDAEEVAMALTFIEMEGIVDESTSRRLFLQGGAASGRTFTAILTRHLKGIPYTEVTETMDNIKKANVFSSSSRRFN